MACTWEYLRIQRPRRTLARRVRVAPQLLLCPISHPKEETSKAGFDWTVTYPNDVIGVAKGNFTNLTTTLGLLLRQRKRARRGYTDLAR